MGKWIMVFILLIIMLAVQLSGCKVENDYHKLSDLGGIYNTSEDEIDFSLEITDNTNLETDNYVYSQIEQKSLEASADGIYNNKLIRWGLKRNPNHQPPDADPGAPELLKKYGGLYIGDPSEKTIYLTFDEGYENGYTPQILDVLKDNNAKAVFFITGPYLKEHQELVRRMVEEGHIVGNHTIHHPSLPSIENKQLEEEVLGLDRVFSEKFGKHMKYLRPPKGEFSERTLAVTSKLGYTNVFWSFAYDDWYKDKVRGSEYAYKKIMDNLHNGAILLLHAVSKDNADALDKIIKGARKEGYEIGDIEKIN